MRLDLAYFAVANLAALACVVIAGLGCALGWESWGWFLLVAPVLVEGPPQSRRCGMFK